MTDYPAKKRRDLKSKGKAMSNPNNPDRPRFPISNAEDLANAIRLAGHAKGDKGKVKAYIKRRASALGLSSRIPSGW